MIQQTESAAGLFFLSQAARITAKGALMIWPGHLTMEKNTQKKQKTRTPYYSKCNVEASKNAFKQFCVVTTFTVAIVWGSCFRLFILFHSLKICDTFHMNRMTKLIYDGYFL